MRQRIIRERARVMNREVFLFIAAGIEYIIVVPNEKVFNS